MIPQKETHVPTMVTSPTIPLMIHVINVRAINTGREKIVQLVIFHAKILEHPKLQVVQAVIALLLGTVQTAVFVILTIYVTDTEPIKMQTVTPAIVKTIGILLPNAKLVN